MTCCTKTSISGSHHSPLSRNLQCPIARSKTHGADFNIHEPQPACRTSNRSRVGDLVRVARESAYGALQAMAAGFAAGSDLAGASGAGIARSCPIASYGKPPHFNELRSPLPSAHTGRRLAALSVGAS
jgi:hypothetical protein